MNNQILLIDDDEELCEELREILEGEGFQVQIAHDGAGGWKFFEQQNYFLVILDLKLPKINGLELLKMIKGKQFSQKVIILSGRPLETKFSSVGEGLDEETILTMADAVMNKPVKIEVLLKKIQQFSFMSERV